MRKVMNTNLHRVAEVDEASAVEGGYIHPHDWRSNQGRVGQPPASKSERKAAGFVLAVTIGSLLAAALVHWWSS